MVNEFKDYYEILEVHHNASVDVIKNAYRTLAKKYHPDTSGMSVVESNEKMTMLNEAFDILFDETKRTQYHRLWSQQHTVSHNNAQSAKKNEESVHFSANDQNMLTMIDNTCSSILELLDKNIEKTDGAFNVARNKIHCDKALTEFTKVIPYGIEGLKKNAEAYRNAEIIVSLTLWRLGTSFTWANEFITASALLKQALTYAKPTDEFFSRLENASLEVNKSAEAVKKRKEDKKNKRIIFAGAIIAFFIIYFLNSGDSKPNTSSRPTNPPGASPQIPPLSQVNKPPISKKPSTNNVPSPVPMIPKTNVVTQYVPKEPILNDDGSCEITIDNTQNDYPVFVRIWSLEGKPSKVRSIHIRQGDKFTAKSLNPGNYDIRYARILENDVPSNANKSKSFELEQIKTKDGIRYSILSLTLYRVRDGNTTTTSIPLSEL